MYYGIKVYPYAHPQHLKVLKHFAYIHYGCGMQSMGVCSLIHDTTIQAQPYPSFPKIHPHLHMYYGIRVYPYAHPQHLKVLKHFVYIQYGCGMQSKGVCGLNLTPQHHTGSAKQSPTCTRITAIRVYPYPHPQHLKVLKHFVYIQYGCGVQSMGVGSLQ